MKKVILDTLNLTNDIVINNIIYVNNNNEYICGYLCGTTKEGVLLGIVPCTQEKEHVLEMYYLMDICIEANNLSKKEDSIKEVEMEVSPSSAIGHIVLDVEKCLS